MNPLRTFLYWLARFLGDVQALRRGPGAFAKRQARKVAGRAFGRMANGK